MLVAGLSSRWSHLGGGRHPTSPHARGPLGMDLTQTGHRRVAAKGPGQGVSPPTPEQLVHLFRLAEQRDPALAAFILLAASSGARRGELLRWSDVDLDRAVLAFERGIALADGDLIELVTRTRCRGRRVTLDADTVAAFEDHRAAPKRSLAPLGLRSTRSRSSSSHEVEGSAPWRPDSTLRAFRMLCEQADISSLRLHDLRHFVATRLLASGIEVRTVAGRLGHRNPATTLNVYAPLRTGGGRRGSECSRRGVSEGS